MPIGIPGMGKSTFIEKYMRPFFEGLPSCVFTDISNDRIRRELIDEFLAANPGKTDKDSHEATFAKT